MSHFRATGLQQVGQLVEDGRKEQDGGQGKEGRKDEEEGRKAGRWRMTRQLKT